ncbi:MAG: MFS transporter [Mycobacteriales bacterium]
MRLTPGWRVVAAVCVLLTCVSGFGFYSLAVYVHALTADGSFSLTTVSRASSAYLLTTGLAGVAVASLLSRADVRVVLAAGAASMAAGLALLGQVHRPATLFGAYVLLGLGQAGTGVVPGTTLVARWFVRRRAAAMAVASTGLSLGGIAVAPAVGAALQGHGLGTVTAAAAAVFLVVCLLATSAVVPHPGARGLAPDGEAAGAEPPATDGVLRADAVRSTVFWAISAAQALALLAQVGGLTHLYALVSSRDEAAVAGAALSCVALGSLSGRFLGGLVLARASTVAFLRLLLMTQAGALLLLGLSHGTPLLLGASLLFGLTIGNVLLAHPLLLGEVFGQRDFAKVISLSGLVATAGTTSGPLLVGQLRETTGSYAAGYLAVAAASVLGALLLHVEGAPSDASHDASHDAPHDAPHDNAHGMHHLVP